MGIGKGCLGHQRVAFQRTVNWPVVVGVTSPLGRFVPVVILLMFVERYNLRGLALGAVK
jgi:hypothetical protein